MAPRAGQIRTSSRDREVFWGGNMAAIKERVALKRIRFQSSGRFDDEWPLEDEPTRSHHLYHGRLPYRKMRVVVDADLLKDVGSPTELAARNLLSCLLEHRLLSVLRYADEGPDSSVERNRDGACKGWVFVDSHDPGNGWIVVVSVDQDRAGQRLVREQEMDNDEGDSRIEVYLDLTPSEARRKKEADLLAVQVARTVGADVFITEREFLRIRSRDVEHGPIVCSVEESLGVLGLYLRSQGEFPVKRNLSLDRNQYYWVGAKELLPEGWRWLAACTKDAGEYIESRMPHLGVSLFQRIARVLELRDQIHTNLNRPQNTGTHEAALSILDSVLLFLQGAVDISARVAHRVLALKKERRANFLTEEWLKEVQARAPLLASVVKDDRQGHKDLGILSVMRNSIHGAALRGIIVSHQHFDESLVDLPAKDSQDLCSWIETLGGNQVWGLRAMPGGRFSVDPGMFADRLICAVLVLLNDVMKDTPFERLANVVLTEADRGPPISGGIDAWIFGRSIRQSIRWQIGLSIKAF